MNFKQNYLTGFKGSGKSTVGRIFADLLYCSISDLDDCKTLKTGRSIPKIFRQEGEPVCRKVVPSTLFSRIREESGD